MENASTSAISVPAGHARFVSNGINISDYFGNEKESLQSL